MTPEEESGFSFVDKRRVSPDDQQPPAPDAPQSDAAGTDASPPMDEDSVSASQTDLPRLTIRDRLLMCIDILHQGAWIAMGLVADPATGQVEKDMEQARVAIDAVGFLADKVQGELDEATRRELRNLLNDLRVNFVQQMNR